MYCSNCGKPNPDDARVCAYCGASLVGGVSPERRLVRPVRNRKIAGICAGVAQYYGWNVTALRLIWLIAFLLFGVGGLLYLILWIVIPNEGQ